MTKAMRIPMRGLSATAAALAMTILLAGCGPKGGAEEWDRPSDAGMTIDAVPPSVPNTGESSTVTQPASGAGAVNAPGAAPVVAQAGDLPQGVVARVKGADFVIKDQPEKTGVRGDDLVVSHYFTAVTEIELTKPVEAMETTLAGQNRDGAVPVFGMLLETVGGKYASYRWDDRPIDGDQVLKDEAKLPAGKYKMTLSYFRDTVGQMRPTLTVKRIVFKGAAE